MITSESHEDAKYQEYREQIADAWKNRAELNSLQRRIKSDEELSAEQREELAGIACRRIRQLTDIILGQE